MTRVLRLLFCSRDGQHAARPPARGDAGFTLVEALVATLLMAIIVGALAAVTGQWLPNWNRGFARLQRGELLAAGVERVVADLASAVFVSVGRAPAPLLFTGTPVSVTFVRTSIGPNAGIGLEVVQLAESSSQGAVALVRTTAPFMPGADGAWQGEFANPVTVIRAPYRVSFAYAGADHVWHDSWNDPRQLPRAVRVQVRDAATAQILALSTTAAIQAELPASCAAPQTPADCPALANLTAAVAPSR
jgi:general secretion pathway protein J